MCKFSAGNGQPSQGLAGVLGFYYELVGIFGPTTTADSGLRTRGSFGLISGSEVGAGTDLVRAGRELR